MTGAYPVLKIERGLKSALKTSIFIHIIFLTIFFTSSPTGRNIQKEGVYRISIKSLPPGIPQKGPTFETEKGSTSYQKETASVVKIPSSEQLKSSKETKTKTNEKAVSTVKQEKEKKVKKKESAGENDILAMLNSARKELSRGEAPQGKQTSSGAGSGELQTGATLSGKAREYYDSVEKKIKESWVLPGAMAQEAKKLRTIVGIIVSRDGTIEKIWIEQSSGNIYYDRAALRAVKKSSPLPEIPPEMPDKELEIGIIF
jgi:TonB family protein